MSEKPATPAKGKDDLTPREIGVLAAAWQCSKQISFSFSFPCILAWSGVVVLPVSEISSLRWVASAPKTSPICLYKAFTDSKLCSGQPA